MNILEKITERTKERIEEEKKIVPLEEVQRQAEEKSNPCIRTGTSSRRIILYLRGKESFSIQRIDRTGFSIC